MARAIKLSNLLRRDIIEITRLQQLSPAGLHPLEYYLLQSTAGDYLHDGEAWHVAYQTLINELAGRASPAETEAASKATKGLRIYWLGEDTPEYRIFNLLEDYGASLVGCDSRLSFYYELIAEAGNPVTNLAKWTWRMPCNLSTVERMQVTLPHIRDQKADAVIIHSNVGSRNLAGAEKLVSDVIKDETGLPVLSIETSPTGQIIDSIKSQIHDFVAGNSR